MSKHNKLTPTANLSAEEDISEIIALAWSDKASFDAITSQFAISEAEVIRIMRSHLKPSSFKLWRKRVSGRGSKHPTKSTNKHI